MWFLDVAVCTLSCAVLSLAVTLGNRDKAILMEITGKHKQPTIAPLITVSAQSTIQCAVMCQMSPNCTSIAFGDAPKLCSIFDKTFAVNDDVMQTKTGVDYYKVNEVIGKKSTTEAVAMKDPTTQPPKQKTIKAHHFDTQKSTDHAEEYCKGIGGTTATVLSAQDHKSAEKAIESKANAGAAEWAGYHIALKATREKFYWHNGKELKTGDFQRWRDNKVPTITADLCGILQKLDCKDCDTKYIWTTYKCADEKSCCYGVLCEVFE